MLAVGILEDSLGDDDVLEFGLESTVLYREGCRCVGHYLVAVLMASRRSMAFEAVSMAFEAVSIALEAGSHHVVQRVRQRGTLIARPLLPPRRRGPGRPSEWRTMWDTIHGVSDLLAWLAIGTFLLAIAVDVTGHRRRAAKLAAAAWVTFGGFWFAMFPYFYFEFRSPLESALSLAAVPLCLVAAYHLASGRTSLLLLSRAVGIMGLIYLPAMLYEPATRLLIETVTVQSHMGMELVGYSPGIEEGRNGYESRFAFEGYSTYIILACTGIGSIAIFGGLIAATAAPLRRKVLGVGVAVTIIWILNLARNVFVGLAAPLGWFDYPIFDAITITLAGPGMRTSFFVSHHLIAQPLAVFALVGITFVVIRIVPEVLEALEQALFVATGRELDLDIVVDETAVRTASGE